MKKNKIFCKECQCTCCDDMKITLREGKKGIMPDKLKIGSWLYVAGVVWKKKKNGKWRCRAFNSSRRLCSIYKFRPPLCRGFQCAHAKKKKIKMPDNWPKPLGDDVYVLKFDFSRKQQHEK